MTRPLLVLSCLGLVLSCAACDPTSATLTVRVQTGFRAGRDFTAVRTDVLAGSVRCEQPLTPGSDARAAFPTEQPDFVIGAFTGTEARGLSPGIYTARVTLFTSSGEPLAHRCVVTSLTNDRVVRVALTVDCLGVMCPAPAGSPQFDQCLNGRCVTEECNPDDASTLEQCCDRSALGALCDTDPTLCESGDDCGQTLMCSSAPSCEGGACIEPVEDLCGEGQYCDALANMCVAGGEPPPDAGPRDAGMDAGASDAGELDAPSADPDAFLPTDPDARTADAFVPAAEDAPFPDVFVTPDAFVMPDVFIGIDVFVTPDAFVMPDTFVTPDAFVSGGPEGSCTNATDGDSDGLIDCEDTDCVGHPDCIGLGCTVAMDFMDPGAEGLPVTPRGPVRWWRTDRNFSTRPFGVCGWGDIIGGLVLRPTSMSRASLSVPIGGSSLIAVAPGDVLSAPDPLALPQDHARTIIVIGRHSSAGVTRVFVTGATNRPALVTGLRHEASGYAYENAIVIGMGGGPVVSGLAHEYLAMPSSHTPSTSELRINGMLRTLADLGEMSLPYAANRQYVGSAVSTGMVEVLEIIVYDRMLDAPQRAMVEAYASARILAAGS